jgi:NAD-dependent SIR2 family protein deacetylase
MQRPHVVILGAGASVAACLEGDKNGRRLPTMENLVEILGLDTLLAKNGITNARENFEALYSSLYSDRSQSGLTREIETAVHNYFSSLELPDHPTAYDHLLLSLRRKDAVFTFNWDPFLFEAWVRNRRFGLPEIFFLHGNVRAAYCPAHPNLWGAPWCPCPECHAKFVPTKLLYPVTVKN